jgi:predicted nucleic acid-binding protein
MNVNSCVFCRIARKQEPASYVYEDEDVLAFLVYEADILIFQSFLRELENNGQLRNINRSYIEAKLRRIERHRVIAYPEDNQDEKWVKLAVSIGASHIISTDPDLLCLPPNSCNNHKVECISPQSYLEQQCPDLV